MQKLLHIGRFVVVMLHLEKGKHSVITKQTIYNMKIQIICMVYNIPTLEFADRKQASNDFKHTF